MKRTLSALVIAALATIGLTACDPPMPPSVAAQIAEQTFTCIDGEAKVALPAGMTDLGNEWLATMQSSCTDTLMSFTPTDEAGADIVLSSYPITTCAPIATVPVAVEAADFAFSLSTSTTLYLSPKTIAGIMNREITTWNDPAISKENPDTEMPDLPIALRDEVDELAFNAMSKYTEHYGSRITGTFTQVKGQTDVAWLEEGEIALLPHSIAFAQGFSTASLILDPIDGEPQYANAEGLSIGSGASQWVPKQTDDNVAVTQDYSAKPQVLDGMETASPPYQAIYPVFLNICNDTLLNRAVSFFFLRLDSQGSLAASVYTPLPENVRVVSLVAVKRGLPVPTAKPEDNG